MALGSRFDELEALAHADLQDEFATVWMFEPMTVKPNMPPQSDSSRLPAVVNGVFDWQSKDVKLGLAEVSVASREPYLCVHRDCAPRVIKRGDRWVRSADGVQFETVEVNRDGYSGVEIKLVQLGRPT